MSLYNTLFVLLALICITPYISGHATIEKLKQRVDMSSEVAETMFIQLPIPPSRPFHHVTEDVAPISLAAVSTTVSAHKEAGAQATTIMEGPPGPPGPPGPAGAPGGPKGDKGDKGDNGPRGDRGPQGPAGEQGIPGEQGLKGDKGDKGPRGDVGPRGLKGEPGPIGNVGPVGPAGPEGAMGPKGDKGERGEVGLAGARGPAGRDGAVGAKGDKGDRGDKGDKGERGVAGPRGTRGPKGEKGTMTITYDGNTRIITGEKGPRGEAGERGEQGLPGLKGERGEKGDKGDKGEPGVIDEKQKAKLIRTIQKADKELIKRQNAEISELNTKVKQLLNALQHETTNQQKLQTRLEEVEARTAKNTDKIKNIQSWRAATPNAARNHRRRRHGKNAAARRDGPIVRENHAVNRNHSGPVEYFNLGPKRVVVPEYLNCDGPCAHLRPAAITGDLHSPIDESKVLLFRKKQAPVDGRVEAITNAPSRRNIHHHHFTSDVPIAQAIRSVRASRSGRSSRRSSSEKSEDRSHLSNVVNLIHSGFAQMSALKSPKNDLPANTTPAHRRIATRVVDAVFDAARAGNAVEAARNPVFVPSGQYVAPPTELSASNDPAGPDTLLEVNAVDDETRFSALKKAVAQAAARVVAKDYMAAKATAAPLQLSEMSASATTRVTARHHMPRRAMTAQQLAALFPAQPELLDSEEPEMI